MRSLLCIPPSLAAALSNCKINERLIKPSHVSMNHKKMVKYSKFCKFLSWSLTTKDLKRTRGITYSPFTRQAERAKILGIRMFTNFRHIWRWNVQGVVIKTSKMRQRNVQPVSAKHLLTRVCLCRRSIVGWWYRSSATVNRFIASPRSYTLWSSCECQRGSKYGTCQPCSPNWLRYQ